MDQRNASNTLPDSRPFLTLTAANAISRFGDAIDMIAFSWLTYQITTSAAWSAVVVGVNQLVSVLLQPIMGSVVEVRNKKRVMVWSDFIRFLTITVLIALYRRGMASAPILVCFTALVSFVETFRIPAGVSIIPALLREDVYDKGISLNNSMSKCFDLIGLMSAAALISWFGADGVIFLDGLTFLLSGILISTIPYSTPTPPEKSDSHYLAMTAEGVRFLWAKKPLLIICTVCAFVNASVIPFESLQSAYINLYFEAKVQLFSAVSIVISLGMLAGFASYRFLPDKYTNASILSAGGLVIGLFYLTVFLMAEIAGFPLGGRAAVLLSASFLVGTALGIMNNYVQIYFIKEVDPDFLSRISSISATVTYVLSPVTAFTIGLLATVLSTAAIFFVWSFVVILGFTFLCSRMRRLTLSCQSASGDLEQV